ncbi:MAG: translation initiation factor IF-3 [bacterium]
MKKRTRINDQIRVPRVKVIDENGEMIGEIETSAALQMAKEKELDLIEVSPNANPPVTKILDFGSYQYRQKKQERKHKSKQKKFEIKGVRISMRISDNDFNFKVKQANNFLDQGHKVRVELIVKGRENQHINLAYDNIQKFVDALEGEVVIEQKAAKQRLGLACVVARKS